VVEEFKNIHGRKLTRGIRPFLLIPKVLAVAVYFGGLVAAAAVWFIVPGPQNKLDPTAITRIDQIGRLFDFVIVPGLLAAILFGVLLFFQHSASFARLRWWQIKMVVLLAGVPGAHFFMSSRLALVRAAWHARDINEAAERQLSAGFVVIMGVSTIVVILGRLKPRLGQNWARSYPTPNQTRRTE